MSPPHYSVVTLPSCMRQRPAPATRSLRVASQQRCLRPCAAQTHAIWPESATITGLEVLPDCDPTCSMAFTTSKPSQTWPKTTCLPSNHCVLTVQRKNCEPLVLGPALAMDKTPGPVCLREK